MRIHAAALVYFDAVRRHGSIRAAARQLNVASSAVNRQILKLEAEIGAPLFERIAGGVRLTAAGEALARHAVVVFQDLDRVRGEIAGLRGARLGHVSIAAVEGLCGAFLPGALDRLAARAPGVTVTALAMGSAAILDAVAEGNADVGLAFDLPRRSALRQVVVTRFRIGAVVAPGHPLARRDTASFADCLDGPLILPDESLSIRARIAPLLEVLPPDRGVPLQTSSIELMQRRAEGGGGIAFQTRVGIDERLAAGRLVFVPLVHRGQPVWSELGIYVRAGRALPPSVDLALRELGDHLVAMTEKLEA